MWRPSSSQQQLDRHGCKECDVDVIGFGRGAAERRWGRQRRRYTRRRRAVLMAGGCHHFRRCSRRPDGSSQLVGGTEKSGRPSASIVIVHRPCCCSVLPRTGPTMLHIHSPLSPNFVLQCMLSAPTRSSAPSPTKLSHPHHHHHSPRPFTIKQVDCGVA